MAGPIVRVGPGPESVGIAIYAAGPGSARWDRSTWDGGTWAAAAWQAVGCEVGEATAKWGATDEAGILSVAAAGEIDITTIDPARILDPLNTASPLYGAVKPGTPLRIVGLAPGQRAVATGFIDQASHDLAAARGRIRAIDGIAYLAQTQLPAGTVLPNTLRARVRAVVAAVGLATIVPVEPEVPATVQLIAKSDFEVDGGWSDSSPGFVGHYRESYGGTSPNGSGAFLTCVVYTGTADYPGVRSDPASIVAGGAYTVGGWHRGQGTKRTRSIRVEWLRQDGTVINSVDLYVDAALADGAWRYASQAVVAPAGAERARIYAFTSATAVPANEQWSSWDDLTLTGVNPDATGDPPVAAHDGTARSAWAVISDAALDALTYVWIDPTGTLRFRSWGSFPDAPLSIGCPPPDADAGERWLPGLSTIKATASGDAIRNSVRAYASAGTWAAAITDPVSIARYGPRPFDVDRVVPDRATWASRILADRADAGLEVAIGTVRPYTALELAALLDLGLGGPSIVRIRDDAHGEPVDLDTGMIGATIGITAAGWRWSLVTMISRVEWDAIDPEPPIPPEPPAGTWHTETRTYIATSDALLALSSGGAKYGAGASTSLPVGVWQGWTYRSCVRFPAIPWTKVRAIRTATLKVRSSTQVRVGFGGSPKTQLRRITEDWTAGSASSPGSGNAVVWPGPATTTSGAVTSSLPTGQNVDKSIRVDALVRPWAPASVGGTGAPQYGLELREASSSASNTGEVWPVEQGGAARPSLVLELEIFD